MAVCDFITLSLWIFLVNLFVEIISLSFKTRLGFDFRGTAIAPVWIALPILALMDLIAIIAAFKLRNRQKVSRKLIVGLFCMVFLVKFGIVVMLIAVNGHVLTAHWILMPYNSRTLVAFIELICNNLTFLYHFIMSLVLLQPVVFPRIFDKKVRNIHILMQFQSFEKFLLRLTIMDLVNFKLQDHVKQNLMKNYPIFFKFIQFYHSYWMFALLSHFFEMKFLTKYLLFSVYSNI